MHPPHHSLHQFRDSDKNHRSVSQTRDRLVEAGSHTVHKRLRISAKQRGSPSCQSLGTARDFLLKILQQR
jgi:hypothetical protein